jgi:hypothetical protein
MVGGTRDTLADLRRHVLDRPLALSEEIDDLGAPPAPERSRDRGERVEQSPLRRPAITHIFKLTFE